MKKEQKINTSSGSDTKSGIIIKDNISLSIENKRSGSVNDAMILMLIAFFAAIGSFGSLFSTYSFNITSSTYILIAGVMTLAFSLLQRLKKRRLFNVSFGAVFAILVWLQRTEFIYGFCFAANTVIKRVRLDYRGIGTFYIPMEYDESQCLAVFFTLLVLVFAFALSYAITRGESFIFAFLLTFPLVELGMLFGISPNSFAFALVLGSWVAMLAVSKATYREFSDSNPSSFIRWNNTFLPKHNFRCKVVGGSAAFLGIFTVIAFLLVSAAADLAYVRDPRVIDLRQNLQQELRDFSIESLTDKLSSINPFRNIADSGRIGNHDRSGDMNREMLRISTVRNTGGFYLRGYVGSIYDGSGFTPFADDVYDENGAVFAQMNDISDYPQSWLHSYIDGFDDEVFNIDVKNVKASDDYSFVPYGFLSGVEGCKRDDRIITADSTDYSFSFVNFDYEYLMYRADSFADNTTHSDYSRFVYDNYFLLPATPEMTELKDTVDSLVDSSDTVYDKLVSLREYIFMNAEYTLKPGSAPRGADIVTYFLNENHLGYCEYYAAAGVVLARLAGIPARYAEGYVVNDSDFNYISFDDESGKYEITLTGSRSHAWAEIYIDGVGWIPFEFTEGYEDLSAVYGSDYSRVTTGSPRETTHPRTQTSTSRSSTSRATTISTVSTSATSGAAGNENSARSINAFGVAIGVILLFLAISAGTLVLNRGRSNAARDKALNDASTSQRAVNAYLYMLELLDFAGYDVHQNVTPVRLAELLEKKLDTKLLTSDELSEVAAIVTQAAYSCTELPDATAERLVALSKRTAERLEQGATAYRRFTMHYILQIK